MAEIEFMIDEARQLLSKLQTVGLAWKGRAMAAVPALKVALAAIEKVEWVRRADDVASDCPWCESEFPTHAPDCERQVAIKVLKEAIGG